MRLDPDHVRKIASAIEVDPAGEHTVRVSLPMMHAARQHLSLWEVGLLSRCLAKAAHHAAVGRRLRPEQRVLLALLVHRDSRGAAE